jgi:hypothetical protein
MTRLAVRQGLSAILLSSTGGLPPSYRLSAEIFNCSLLIANYSLALALALDSARPVFRATDLEVCATDLEVCATDLEVCATDLEVHATDLEVHATELEVHATDLEVHSTDL